MKKLGIVIIVAAAIGLLPSLSRAACNATGAVTREILTTGITTVEVRSNLPGSVTFRFTTVDDTFIHAAVVAELNHANVLVTGNATTCGAVASGVSIGGTILQMIVSP